MGSDWTHGEKQCPAFSWCLFSAEGRDGAKAIAMTWLHVTGDYLKIS